MGGKKIKSMTNLLTVIEINILIVSVIFTSLNALFCPQCVMDFIL